MRTSVGWLVALLLTLWASAPLAKPTEESKKVLAEGKALLERGEFERALQIFRDGHALHDDPELLLYAGQTLLKLYRYQEAKDTFEAYLRENPKSKSKADVERILKKIPAQLGTSLTIASFPSGATLWLDTQVEPPIGTTPFKGNIPPGPHTIIAKRDGFSLKRVAIEVKANVSNELVITLSTSPALLSIETTPPGAQVFLGEQSLGTTPFKGEIPDGPNTIFLKKSGYGTVKHAIAPKPGESLSFTDALPPPPGFVRVAVASAPPGATYSVDGSAAEALQERLELSPGEHTLTVEAKGYRPFSTTLRVTTGEEITLPLELRPRGAHVYVESQPAGATIQVNGAPLGTAPNPKPLSFPTGTQATIRVEKPGHRPYERTFTAEADADYTLAVQLRDHAPRKAIAAFGVAVLAASAGGVFGVAALQNDAVFREAPTPELFATIQQQALFSNIGFGVAGVSVVGAALLLRREGGFGHSPGKISARPLAQ